MKPVKLTDLEVLKVAQIHQDFISYNTWEYLKKKASFVDTDKKLDEFLISVDSCKEDAWDSDLYNESVKDDLRDLVKLAGKTISYFQITSI